MHIADSTGRIGRTVWLLRAAALLLTVLVYLPSLHGTYVFDDYPNIVDNKDVHLTTLDAASLKRAALSSPSPVLIRPLAMLSFALDWYVGGGSPFEMKVVNLAIHLVNGLLLFALLRRVTRTALDREGGTMSADVLALWITAAWLLAPINFTAVSYIVQRMESLCQLFVLAGLLGYVSARQAMLAGRPGFVKAATAIVLGTGLGVLAKESAILLPLYAVILECTLFRFAGPNRRLDRRLSVFYLFVLVIPACIAAVWALSQAFSPGAWTNRPFTLGQRLLTEPRILLDYVQWSLVPTPNALALYHDSIPLSRGLFDPLTTLASIAALAAAAIAAWAARTSRSLVAIGIGWFLCAHLLTATVIPLELIYEHRNYFASIGLYLALFSLLVPAGRQSMAIARSAACLALIVLFASVTWIRALDWSNPVAFALSEAAKNPDSPRTAYELGRTYVILSRYRADSPFVPKANEALTRAAALPGANALPDQGLLLLAGRLRQSPPAGAWQRLQDKIAAQPLSSENVTALYSLSQCAVSGDCQFPANEMVEAFLAALRHSPPNGYVLSTYASYAINVLHDPVLALELAQEGVQRDPRSLQARRNLMLVLATTGRRKEAAELYQRTLREVPEAAGDAVFRRWAEDLLATPVPAAPAVPKSPP